MGAAAGVRALPYQHNRHGAGEHVIGASSQHSVVTPIRNMWPQGPLSHQEQPLALPRAVTRSPLSKGTLVCLSHNGAWGQTLPGVLAAFGALVWGYTGGSSPHALSDRAGLTRGSWGCVPLTWPKFQGVEVMYSQAPW